MNLTVKAKDGKSENIPLCQLGDRQKIVQCSRKVQMDRQSAA